MDLKEIFEHKIKIESKVKSIDALFMNKRRFNMYTALFIISVIMFGMKKRLLIS